MPPLRILIVDDSALARCVLRELLQSDPEIAVVGEAGDGREALDLVAALRPDLVTLDVRMPVMDGVETTKQIMAYYPTPILVLTATLGSELDIGFRMLGAGALDVMEKPLLSDQAAVSRARMELLRKVRLLARVKVVTHLRGRRKGGEAEPALPGAGSSSTGPTSAPAVPGSASLTPWPPLPRAGKGEAAAAAGVRASSPRLRATPVPGTTTLPPAAPVARPAPGRGPIAQPFPAVVIGASTGGPRVLRIILARLPQAFPAAVLVVQHIAQGFSAGLAEWLSAESALPVRLAAEGEPLRPGAVLVAPDRYDLLVQPDGAVHLSGLPLLLQRPAIDIVMQSVAAVFGAGSAGVLLTGMGRDGAHGLQAIRRVGGLTIAQDEASCAVSGIYGMPRAAVELGAAAMVLPPEQIAAALVGRLAPDLAAHP